MLWFHCYNRPQSKDTLSYPIPAMERVCRRIACVLGLLIASCLFGFAQNSEKWIRVQSDNGEFSIDFPEKYNAYSDNEGFSLSNQGSSDDYQLTDMRMVNAYVDGTLLSVEIYKGPKAAVKALMDVDSSNRSKVKKSEVKQGAYLIRQMIISNEKSRTVRKYFNSNDHIYILTAATRGPETAAAKRFLDSMVFASENRGAVQPDVVKISSLKLTPIVLEQDLSYTPGKLNKPSKIPVPQPEPDIVPLAVVVTPRASYTNDARESNVDGSIRVKLTLSEDGFIPKILVMGRALPGGLARQTVFAAIRTKFLPKLKNNVPITVVATFEYGFNIY
jgi:Gram-negative bacterial TonB protein C-terminal